VNAKRVRVLLAALAFALGLRILLGSDAPRSIVPEGSAAALEKAPDPAARGEAISATTGRNAPAPESGEVRNGAGTAAASPPWPVRPSNEDTAVVDLFAKPPPPPPIVPVAPPVAAPPPVVPVDAVPEMPKAPPFPYTAIGDWTENQTTAVFLARQNEVKLTRVNDLLDGVYRIQSVVPGKMVIVYVPMNQIQEITWTVQR
jgi:hypothetical protein